jgi:hypothetical protein
MAAAKKEGRLSRARVSLPFTITDACKSKCMCVNVCMYFQPYAHSHVCVWTGQDGLITKVYLCVGTDLVLMGDLYHGARVVDIACLTKAHSVPVLVMILETGLLEVWVLCEETYERQKAVFNTKIPLLQVSLSNKQHQDVPEACEWHEEEEVVTWFEENKVCAEGGGTEMLRRLVRWGLIETKTEQSTNLLDAKRGGKTATHTKKPKAKVVCGYSFRLRHLPALSCFAPSPSSQPYSSSAPSGAHEDDQSDVDIYALPYSTCSIASVTASAKHESWAIEQVAHSVVALASASCVLIYSIVNNQVGVRMRAYVCGCAFYDTSAINTHTHTHTHTYYPPPPHTHHAHPGAQARLLLTTPRVRHAG